MKKFIKGVRFAPKNYSDEVEEKIQHYKRKATNYRHAIYCVLRSNWQVFVKAQKSILHCWIISRQISVKGCRQQK